ncbi:CU044_5270 family protein [Micromonospora rifamycinica]|uniref:CU044_5270 family protein n=1 Tax=Micromonospora rifamycinica TaxID=291594 RepID=UPI002E2D839C|nr:CU044_5270 family protein [Micromonospora rifamycinica]
MDLVKQLGEELAPQKHEPITPLPAAAFRDLPPRPFRAWQTGAVAIALLGVVGVVGLFWTKQGGPESRRDAPGAIAVLENAAAVSQESAIPPPSSAGFIFTEIVSSLPEQAQQADGSIKMIRTAPVIIQVWLPVDPMKSGKQRQRPASKNSQWEPWIMIASCQEEQNKGGAQDSSAPCVRGALPRDFPSTPVAALAWLRGEGDTSEPSPSSSSGKTIEGRDALAFERARTLLAAGTYLSPNQRSIIFKAIAMISGVVAFADAQDGAGRPGVGISAHGSEALVFDSKSFAFLGTTSSAVMRQSAAAEAGTIPS